MQRRRAAALAKAVVLTLALALGVAAAFSVTAAAATVVTVTASDDTFVTEPGNHKAQGSLTYLRVDANPARRGLLRFDVSGLDGAVARATLKLYSLTRNEQGLNVHAVANSDWSETTVTHDDAPSVSAVATGTTGPLSTDTWAVADVTPLVSGDGVYTFALTTESSRPVMLASKEAGGDTAPQLTVETVEPAPTSTAAAPLPTTTELPPPTTTELPPPTTTEPPPPTTTELPPPTTTEPPPPTTTELPPPTTTEPPPPTTTELPPPTTTQLPPPTTTAPTDTTPPSIPTGLTLTGATVSTLSLSWSPSSDDVGISGYDVYVDGAHAGPTSGTTFTATGLSCGTSYDVTVDAHDAAGNNSGQSTPLTVATSACPDLQAPTVPGNFRATAATTSSVTVAWNASIDDIAVAGYGVFKDEVFVTTTPSTGYVFGSLSCGTTYVFGVEAYDSAGNVSSPRATLTTATAPCPDTEAPTVPGNLRATAATTSSVTVAWNASIDDIAVAGYSVFKDEVFVTTTPSTGYVFGSLSCGTTYVFGVEAYDGAGNVSSPRATLTTATAPCTAPPSGGDQVIAIAGDIAGDGTGDTATALLLDALGPNAVLTAGDNAYEDGSSTQYTQYYEPTWGRHKAKTYPTPGNHEYQTSGASGYFGYFGSRAGTPGQGYYSYDLGAWHLIALNSEIAHSAGSAQVTWLENDLAATGAPCVLAYWHKPRFTAGNYSDMSEYQPFWDALYAADADVVVNGHDHNYQRYMPMTPTGARDDARGIREFVAGTGGRSHYSIRADSRRESAEGGTYGVLKLTLRATGYDWQFVAEAGRTFADAGSAACH